MENDSKLPNSFSIGNLKDFIYSTKPTILYIVSTRIRNNFVIYLQIENDEHPSQICVFLIEHSWLATK